MADGFDPSVRDQEQTIGPILVSAGLVVRAGISAKVQDGSSVSTTAVCGGIHIYRSAMRTLVDPSQDERAFFLCHAGQIAGGHRSGDE